MRTRALSTLMGGSPRLPVVGGRDRHVPRAVWWLQVGATVAVAAFAAHAVLPDGGALARFFDERVYYAPLVAASLLCLLRAVLVRDQRAAWTSFAIALAAWTAGDVYFEVALADLDEPPFPSPADALYLTFYPFAYAGLLLLARPRVAALQRSVLLDGVTAVLAVAAATSALFVERVASSSTGSLAAVATNVAYPVGDALLIALLVGIAAVTRWQVDRVTALLAASFATAAVADGIYLRQIMDGTYVVGTWLDALWPASMLLIGIAAWARAVKLPRVSLDGKAFVAVPIVCGTAAVLLLARPGTGTASVALAAAAVLSVFVRLALSMSENHRLLGLSRAQADTDALTGLANRRRLLHDLDGTLESGSRAVLVLFDLDGFKRYNDTFGHPAGDALLVRLGARLAGAAGADAAAYRLGGDEFCLLAHGGCDVQRLLADAEDALTETGEGFVVSASFGAVFVPDEAATRTDVLALADQRLYAQKHLRSERHDRAHEVVLQALYEKEPSLEGHLREVVELAVAVGRELGFDPGRLDTLRRAAQLHDIGKIAIPDEILRKVGELNAAERRFMEQHTVIGRRILAVSPALREVAQIVYASHERWDGSGYPDRVSGDAIPLEARVIAACDAYAAMLEHRPYRSSCSSVEARCELERCAGTQFDPAVVDALLRVAGRVARPVAS